MELLPSFESVDDAVVLPLRPREVVIFPLAILWAQRPPKACLQRCSHDLGIVAFLDEILVGWKRCCWEFPVDPVGLVDFLQKQAVVALLQIKILLFVFWIRQVFGQLLNLLRDLFQTDRRLGFFGLGQKFPSLIFTRVGERLDLVATLSSTYLLLVLPFNQKLVVHSSLDNKERRRDEGFLKQLGLEHFYQVFDPELLRLLSHLLRCHLLVAILLCLLLLKQTNFSRFLQGKL